MVRVKRRYIVFELIPNDPKCHQLSVNEKDIIEAIRQTVSRMFGDFGLASVQQTIQLKRFSLSTRTGVLATKRNNYGLTLTCLPFIRRVRQTDCIFRTIHLSGTIRGSLKGLRRHHNKQIVDLRKQMNSMSKIKDIEKGIKDIESSLVRQQMSEPNQTSDNI